MRLVGVGVAVAMSLLPAQAPGTRPRFPGGDSPAARAQWFQRYRQSNDGIAPAEHRYRAWLQAQQMPVLHARHQLAAAPAGGNANPPATLGGDWTELGPRPENDPQYGTVGGRMTALAVDLGKDPSGNTVYAGAADGGVWMSTNALAAQPTFTPIGDNLPTLAVGGLALDSSTTPTTIYVGSGEGNESGDSYDGVGILKSTDGGQTWTAGTGPNFLGSAVTKLLVDPVNPQILLASMTESGVYVGDDFTNTAEAIGIVRSSDGGATWSNVLNGATATDLIYDPASQSYYAAVRGRGIYRSSDQGQTWQALGDPFGNVAVTPANFSRASLAVRGGTLFALITDGNGAATNSADCNGATLCAGLVETINGGANWSALQVPSDLYGSDDQGYYDQYIAAPAGSSLLLIGGIDLWSAPLGSGAAPPWTNLTNSYTTGTVHPDEHAIVCLDASHWYVGNDGGVWYTANAGTQWANLNATIGAIQFYGVTPDPATAGRMLGGSQDNGTVLAGGTLAWPSVRGGDGGHTAINPANLQQLFTENNGVSLQRSDDGGATFNPVVDATKVSGPNEFYVPYVLSPDGTNVYLASDQVWRGPAKPSAVDQGWQFISGNLTHATGQMDPNSDDLTAIAVAPSDANTVYVGAYDGSLSGSTNATFTAALPTWTELQPPGVAFQGPLAAIAVSPTDPKTVLWGFAFLGAAPVLMKSTNGGETGTDIAGNLPDSPINAIVLDPGNPNAIYVATDVGVFSAGDGGAGGANERWARVGDNLPAAAVLSLALTSAGGTPTLVAGTHGRGAWSIPAIAPGSFSMTVSPATISAEVGQTGTATVQTTVLGGSSTVAFTCSPNCTVSPATVAAGGSATLTWTAPETSSNSNLQLSADNGFTMLTEMIPVSAVDFTLSVSPASGGELEAGQSLSATFRVAPVGIANFDAPIAFSCPTAPAGVTCTFTPATISNLGLGQSGTLQVQAAASAAPGPLQLDVRATGGQLQRDDTVSLNLNQFTLAVTPAILQAVPINQPAVFTIAATSATGYSGAIALSCTAQFGAQGGCSLQPASIQAGHASTMTITGLSPPQFPNPAASSFTLTGTSGASVASVSVTVQPQDFILGVSGDPLTTIQGSSGMSRPLVVGSAFGFATPVALSCTSPAGVTCGFSPASVVPGQSGSVTFGGLAGMAASAAIPVTIVGTAGSLVHTLPLTLRNDAAAFVTDSILQSVYPGDPYNFEIFIGGSNGYLGAASAACASGLAFSCSVTEAGNQLEAQVTATGAAGGTMALPIVVTLSDGGANLAETVTLQLPLADFTVLAIPSSLTLSSSPVTASINISSSNASAPMSITCAGLPAGVTCEPLTLNRGNFQGTLTFTLNHLAAAPVGSKSGLVVLLLIVAGGGMLLARQRRRRLVLVLWVAAASFACGGGGGGSVGNTGGGGGGGGGASSPPPAVTSTVTITATDATPGVANPLSHSTTLQLTAP